MGGIILPVYVFYFRHYDISLFQVALLAAVFEATIIIFEIPTGLFADRFGRKLSTFTGFILFALSALIFMSYRNFAGFLVAEIIFGLAETFISGALEALAVDSLDQREKDARLPRLFANRTVFKTSALLIGMISGGLLASWILQALFVPVMIIAGIGSLISLSLAEAGRRSSGSSDKVKPRASLPKAIFRNGAVTALFAIGLFSNFVYEPADQFWQVLFSEVKNIDASFFGFITAIGLILVVTVARFSEKLYDHLALYLSGCFVLTGIALFVAAGSGIYPAITGIVIYFALKELIRPAISTHLNRIFESANRATFLSGYNLTCSIGEVIAAILAGLLAARYGVIFIFYFASAAALAVLFLYLIVTRILGGVHPGKS